MTGADCPKGWWSVHCRRHRSNCKSFMLPTSLRNMTHVSAAAITVLLLVAAGCTSTAPSPTPDPRIDQLQQLTGTLSEEINQLTDEVVQLQMTPAPTPTPATGPTLEEIVGVVERRIDEAVKELPSPERQSTVTGVLSAVRGGLAAYEASRPTPTPGPSLAEIAGVVDNRIAVAISRLPPTPTSSDIQSMINGGVADALASLPPAPTPGPTLDEIEGLITQEIAEAVSQLPSVSIIPQTSASSRASLTGDINISVHPGKPIAGRDVNFALDGLEPWTRVEMEFIDPRTEPAEWVTDDEGHFTRENGDPVTRQTLYADESGVLSWQRIGTKDMEGIWTVRLDIDGVVHTVTYPVSQLQLSTRNVDTVGLEMRHYQGTVSDSYLASLVPTSFAVDLQAHLAWVVRRIEEEYGLRSTQIPDIYLVGDEASLRAIAQAAGEETGFEHGFYRSYGEHPGIYFRTDEFRTGVQRILTHEYVHLMVDELSNGRDIPAWLNEGLADYIETELGLEGERPRATRLLTYLALDQVKAAEDDGLGRSLTELENQRTWNAQTDRDVVSLQYGKAHMAVRYISEEFSAHAPVEIIRLIGNGSSLSGAIQDVLNVHYEELRRRADTWIAEWADSDREEVRSYVGRMNAIYSAVSEQVERRNDALDNNLRNSQRASVLQNVVTALIDLQQETKTVPFPETKRPFHSEFQAYVDTVVDWITLERDYADTGRDRKRTDANAMLPEVNARGAQVWRDLNNLQYVYQVGRY